MLLLLFLLVGLAAGYGPLQQPLPVAAADVSPKVKHIKMWKFKSNKEDYIIYDWIKQWNDRNPGVQVTLELIPFTDYLENKLPTAFATNSAPDIYMISAGGFLKYAKAGCMLPLDRYLSPRLKKDFYGPSLEVASFNGKIMGLPIEREPVALYYNRKLFAERGLAPPRTWAELLRCAKLLNGNGMSGIYLPVLPSDYQTFIFYSFLAQLSDGVVDRNRRASLRTAGQKALQIWRDLTAYNYKFETAIQSTPDIHTLASGKAAMQICGFWSIRHLEKYYPDFQYGVVPVPVSEAPGSRRRSVYGGWFQAVNPGSKYKDEAAAFTVWMWGNGLARPVEWCTGVSTKFPARISATAQVEKLFGRDKHAAARLIFQNQILPYAVPEFRYPSEISSAVSKAIQNAMFTEQPITTVAAKADEAINNYLKQNPGEFK